MALCCGHSAQGRSDCRWLSGLLLSLVGCLWAIIGVPAQTQAPQSHDTSYQRIIGELYPDEVAPFYGFYATLNTSERFALARVIGALDDGEWGLFAALLIETDRATAIKTLELFGSYDAAQLERATGELKANEFDNWQAIPVLLQEESFERARLALLGSEAENACQVAEPDDPIDANSAPHTSAVRICSEAEARFFENFYLKKTRRVSRGVLAQNGEAPWQVQFSLHGASTRYFRSDGERAKQITRFGRELSDWEINHTCGAVYLGARFVLTAAHCIGNLEDRLFFQRRRVHLGSVRIDGNRNLFTIRRVLTHADYKSSTLQNDIALIELTQVPAGYRYLRSARLPRGPARPSRQVPMLLSGWGFSRPANSSSDIFALDGRQQLPAQPALLKGTVWVQQSSECRRNRHFRRRGIDIHAGQICVGSPRGVDSCRGDSGGPLVDTRSDTLIGIVSGSAGCGLAGTPSIFVDVGYYRDWIDRAMAAAPGLAVRRKHKFR